MTIKIIPLSCFPQGIESLCRETRCKGSTVIVTRHDKPIFKLVPLQSSQEGIECGFTKMRDHTSKFLDLLELHQFVFLTSHGKRKASCTKIL